MSKIKQSVLWWCYRDTGLTPEQLTRAIAEAGYPGVEVFEPEHFPLVKGHGLEIVAIQGHFPLEDGLNRRENAARIEGQIRGQIQLAEEWHIPKLICFSGNRNGLDDKTGQEITAENLRRVAKMAEDAGVMLVLETLNSKADHPDFQCDSTLWGVEVCQMVGSPNVKLLYDIYHMQVMEGDIIATIEKYHPYIGHYHTAGCPGRHEIDDSQELYYPAIIRAILKTGYTDYVGQEFIPAGDPVKALRQAFELCNVTL
jgi:hydroxypyruvate isomerase